MLIRALRISFPSCSLCVACLGLLIMVPRISFHSCSLWVVFRGLRMLVLRMLLPSCSLWVAFRGLFMLVLRILTLFHASDDFQMAFLQVSKCFLMICEGKGRGRKDMQRKGMDGHWEKGRHRE